MGACDSRTASELDGKQNFEISSANQQLASAQIVVVGSMNIDLVLRVQEMPLPGETLSSKSYDKVFGGKVSQVMLSHLKSG